MEYSPSGSMESDYNSDDGISSRPGPKTRSRKRKRPTVSSSTDDDDDVLPENILEVEKNLQASAAKNNLDGSSVKKIIKTVVMNDHVLALVKLQEEEEDAQEASSGGLVPKLTRSKVKELKKVSSGKPTWNLDNLELTPIKHIPVKTRPEVQALIAPELMMPDDEDDDEYEPTHDDVPSDDDHTLESCSDLDSQPRTPATPTQQRVKSPRIVKDGPFKVPQELTPARRKLELEKEEATIALRTRSKLSLSETPIEHIESSFVPPDDIPMPAVDDLWNQFLTECLDPAPSARHEDDDEADPEYNVAADPDAHDEDEEALENSIIKISKKELNDLVTELFSIMPEAVDECLGDNMPDDVLTEDRLASHLTTWDGKQELLSEDESTNTAIRISDRITFEGRDGSAYSIGKNELPDESDEEPQYLEIGVLPIKGASTSQASSDAIEEKKCVSITSKVDQLIMETVGTDEEQQMVSQPKVHPNVVANVVRVVDSQPPNVVSIVVGSSRTAVPQPSAPLLLRSLQQARAQLRPRAPRVTRVEVHMGNQRCILPEQVIILQQQLRQHVQLAATNFLQLFVHPLSYGFGPTYKGFIESLITLADKTPNSVVEVCNLRPAMALVNKWEEEVSQDTPENTAFIQYIQDDCMKWAHTTSHNNVYLGDFHVKFKKAVAESPVFLYPYLLPPRPYHNKQRRSAYLPSEDELIALGLDQFWQYVVDNPKLYCPPKTTQTRKRWWFNATLDLICKHMLPFFTIRMLVSHISNVKKMQDLDNPINRFFEYYEVKPVDHRILPFNENMTLHQQPIEELPRTWLRYLAKADPKIRKFLNRSQQRGGVPPVGIPIAVNLDPNAPVMKAPLHTDFTKTIITRRKKKTNVETVTDDKPTESVQTSEGTNNIQTLQTPEGVATNIQSIQTPEGVPTNITTPMVAANIYKLEGSGENACLVPLIIQVNSLDDTATVPVIPTITSKPSTVDITESCEPVNANSNERPITKTVNCNISPITSTRSVTVEFEPINKEPVNVEPTNVEPMDVDVEEQTKEKQTSDKAVSDKPNHCTCCMLLRKVCKRQTQITDYFRKDKSRKSCFCKGEKRPRITKKLIQLANSFKDPYRIAMENLCMRMYEANEQAKLIKPKVRQKKLIEERLHEIEESRTTEAEDLSYVVGYKMKLMARLGTNINLKANVHSIFSNFNTNYGDPLTIAKSLIEVLTGPHTALFRDFLPFLTKEQAAKLGRFKDYFALVCVADLVKMVEEEIVISDCRRTVLNNMHKVLTASLGEPTACEICTSLLPTFDNYPHLAERVFRMFPHTVITVEDERKRVENNKVVQSPKQTQKCQKEKPKVTVTKTYNTRSKAVSEKLQSSRIKKKIVTALPTAAAKECQRIQVQTAHVIPTAAVKECQLKKTKASVANDDTHSKQEEECQQKRIENTVVGEDIVTKPTSIVESQPERIKTPIANKDIVTKPTNKDTLPESQLESETATPDENSTPGQEEDNEMDITLCVDSSEVQDDTDATICGESSQVTADATSQDSEMPNTANVALITSSSQDPSTVISNNDVALCRTLSKDKHEVLCGKSTQEDTTNPNTADEALSNSHDTNATCVGNSSQETSEVLERGDTSKLTNKTDTLSTDSLQNTTQDIQSGASSQNTVDVPLTPSNSVIATADTEKCGDSHQATANVMCDDSSALQNKTNVASQSQNQMDVNETQADYEADHSASEDDEPCERAQLAIKLEPEEETCSRVENNIQIFISDIKSENESEEDLPAPTNRTEPEGSDSEKSMVIDSDNDTIKSESSEWQRDEDKLILQVIKDNLTMEERGDRPILEFIEDKQVMNFLSESLIHKSKGEIRNRIIYLLQMLLLSEK